MTNQLQRFFDVVRCKNCDCMTKTKSGYIYICGKCGKDRRYSKQDNKEHKNEH
ncbi:MAG: hypothetical protein AABY22_32685 [Nanoarchaeota archaeon]